MSAKSNPIQLPLPIENMIIEITLTRGYVTIVDAVDADLAQFKWTTLLPKKSHTPYAYRNIHNGHKYHHVILMHRLILERVLARSLLSEELVDHIDRNGLNNQRSNLRLATHSKNHQNSKTPSNSTSGHKGISWYRPYGKWRAYITVNGKTKHLGYFDNLDDACKARSDAAQEWHGAFARSN